MDKNERVKGHIDSLRPYPLSYLEWLAEKIDKERSPDRYQAIVELISEKKKLQLSHEENGSPHPDARIIKKVAKIRKVYLVFIILAGIAVAYGIILQMSFRDNLENAIGLFVFAMIYLGLRGRKAWVIPLVLICSAILTFIFLIAFLHPAENIRYIVHKVVFGLLSLFFIYQLFFFMKREVRMYFQEKGKVLF